jgi:hypothetical protein
MSFVDPHAHTSPSSVSAEPSSRALAPDAGSGIRKPTQPDASRVNAIGNVVSVPSGRMNPVATTA